MLPDRNQSRNDKSMQTRKQREAAKSAKKPPVMQVAPEHQPLLDEVCNAVQSVRRRTAAEAFEVGYQFSRAKGVLPEKMLGRWISTKCGYAPRHGRNYIAIYEHLAEYREELEAAAVMPTAMFVLASAEPEKIKEVLRVIESGERLTVAQVKHLVKGDKTPAQEKQADVGGMAGLRRAAEAKLKADIALFGTLTKQALKEVESAAEKISKGKNVAKNGLAAKIEVDCRQAHDLLSSAIAPMHSGFNERGNLRPGDVEGSTAWKKAQRLLYRLGDSPRWPGRTEFPAWLVNDVLPMLRFVVHGEPMRAGPELPAREDDAPREGPAPEGARATDDEGAAGQVPDMTAIDTLSEEATAPRPQSKPEAPRRPVPPTPAVTTEKQPEEGETTDA
nr:hypothetical protein RNT25_04449 [arsenite-oxidising bacterium NT-25]